MKTYCVYIHTSPRGKKYVGITCRNVYIRWGHNGMGYYDGRRKHQLPLFYAIQKYGWDNFSHEIIKDNLSKDEACNLEKELIKKYNTTDRNFGYNITSGGEGVSGYVHTEESRKKMSKARSGFVMPEEQRKKISEALKGKDHWWHKGKPLSEETKRKLSIAHKGHIVTEETREKIRQANFGKQHSEETKRKLSEINKNRDPEILKKISETAKKSGKERAKKRLATMKEKYPDGFKQSKESNIKRSNTMRGIPKSEETKQKMRKPKSEEAKKNMALAQKNSHAARKLGISYKEYINMLKDADSK